MPSYTAQSPPPERLQPERGQRHEGETRLLKIAASSMSTFAKPRIANMSSRATMQDAEGSIDILRSILWNELLET